MENEKSDKIVAQKMYYLDVWIVFHYIRNGTIQNCTKHVNSMGGYVFVVFHAIKLSGTNTVGMN